MKKLISSNVDVSNFLLVYASHCFYESSLINKNERINLKYIFFQKHHSIYLDISYSYCN